MLTSYYKELYHYRSSKDGTYAYLPKELQGLKMDTYLEEIHGYTYAYKNQGLYRDTHFSWDGVRQYQMPLGWSDFPYPNYPSSRFLNYIYRIKRLWQNL